MVRVPDEGGRSVMNIGKINEKSDDPLNQIKLGYYYHYYFSIFGPKLRCMPV